MHSMHASCGRDKWNEDMSAGAETRDTTMDTQLSSNIIPSGCILMLMCYHN